MYLEEWLQLLRRLWTSPTEFDYESKYFRMKKAISRPLPLQAGGVPVMNAALSPMGMRFSAKYSDIGLISPHGTTPEEWRPQVEDYKKMAREEFGREIQLWTNCSVVQRETQKAADEYLHRYSEEYLDTEVMDSLMRTISAENNIPMGSERLEFMRRRMAVGAGHPLVGTAQSIAEELAAISSVGIDGVIMTWVDYVDGVDRFIREVLPLLEQAGLRKTIPEKSRLRQRIASRRCTLCAGKFKRRDKTRANIMATTESQSLTVAEIIEQRSLGGYQIWTVVLCGLVLVLDGSTPKPLTPRAFDCGHHRHSHSHVWPDFFRRTFRADDRGDATGPIADRLGRKWPVLFSTLSFAVFSLITVHVTSFREFSFFGSPPALASAARCLMSSRWRRNTFRSGWWPRWSRCCSSECHSAESPADC